MSRRISALVVTLAVLVPALGLPTQGLAAVPASTPHACCMRVGAALHCRTLVLTCCPAGNRHSETTPPVAATTGGTTLVPVHGDHVATAVTPDTVRVLAADAHSLARLKAPPDPLYLKHLTLIV